MEKAKRHIFLYGPPGSGKTTVGKVLSEQLELPFVDLDAQIESVAGRRITEIMQSQGEPAFRAMETAALERFAQQKPSVVSLGGGALLDPNNRACAESAGDIIVLEADIETLAGRLSAGGDGRPLLAGDLRLRLNGLMEKRRSHYDSFSLRIANYPQAPYETAQQIQALIGRFRILNNGKSYAVLIQPGGMKLLGEQLKEMELPSPLAIVTDSNVGPLYAADLEKSLRESGFRTSVITISAGEAHKTIHTVNHLWEEFLKTGMDRKSLVIALGGGVTGDLTGFAASTYMRGIDWVGVPTSLLAMVDSSLGGKTGFDLPYGKNLVGSFHSPRLVVSDLEALSTLPREEFRSGLAEAFKHGVIADPWLFAILAKGVQAVQFSLEEIVRRAVAVKIRYIEADPFEKGIRAALNYGHTVGHAVELVSGFRLRHGEAVSIGMAVEARLAEALSLAEKGLAGEISGGLISLGLPVEIPPQFSREEILQAMRVDKKKQAGKIRFALPLKIGEVKTGIEVEDLSRILKEG